MIYSRLINFIFSPQSVSILLIPRNHTLNSHKLFVRILYDGNFGILYVSFSHVTKSTYEHISFQLLSKIDE
jgi:hypothetical protein